MVFSVDDPGASRGRVANDSQSRWFSGSISLAF
jgi:hypothetical protein